MFKKISWIVIAVVLWVAHPETSTAETWYYTALGDSLAFGALAPVGAGYVPLYKNQLKADTGVRVRLFNLSIPGETSSGLRRMLSRNFFFQILTGFSKVVTLDIGGNDLRAMRNLYLARMCGGPDNQDCLRTGLTLFKENWDAILEKILRLRRFRPTIIRVMDIYYPYVKTDTSMDMWPEDEMTDFEVLNTYLAEANVHIAETSRRLGIPVARVHQAFNGLGGNEDPDIKGYIAFDGLCIPMQRVTGLLQNAFGLWDMLRCGKFHEQVFKEANQFNSFNFPWPFE